MDYQVCPASVDLLGHLADVNIRTVRAANLVEAE